jgi:HEXXH motif-containing protein
MTVADQLGLTARVKAYRRAVRRVAADAVLRNASAFEEPNHARYVSQALSILPEDDVAAPAYICCAEEIALADAAVSQEGLLRLLAAAVDSYPMAALCPGQSVCLRLVSDQQIDLPSWSVSAEVRAGSSVYISLDPFQFCGADVTWKSYDPASLQRAVAGEVNVGPYSAGYWPVEIRKQALVGMGERALTSFTAAVESAYAIITRYAASLRQVLESNVRWIVPIGHPADDIRASFSASAYPTTVFMSTNGAPLQLAEDLVHEASHLELQQLETVALLTRGGVRGLRYYSPWRPDARPAGGLLHAIFVFCRVAELHEMVAATATATATGAATASASSEHDYLARRHELCIARIAVAIAQLAGQNACLEPLGREVCERGLRLVGPRMASVSNTTWCKMEEHYEMWLATTQGVHASVSPGTAVDLMGRHHHY